MIKLCDWKQQRKVTLGAVSLYFNIAGEHQKPALEPQPAQLCDCTAVSCGKADQEFGNTIHFM